MPGVKPPMTTLDTISDAGVVLMAGSRTAIASIRKEARKAGPNPVRSPIDVVQKLFSSLYARVELYGDTHQRFRVGWIIR